MMFNVINEMAMYDKMELKEYDITVKSLNHIKVIPERNHATPHFHATTTDYSDISVEIKLCETKDEVNVLASRKSINSRILNDLFNILSNKPFVEKMRKDYTATGDPRLKTFKMRTNEEFDNSNNKMYNLKSRLSRIFIIHRMYSEYPFPIGNGELVIGNSWELYREFGNDTLVILNRKKKQLMIFKFNEKVIPIYSNFSNKEDKEIFEIIEHKGNSEALKEMVDRFVEAIEALQATKMEINRRKKS